MVYYACDCFNVTIRTVDQSSPRRKQKDCHRSSPFGGVVPVKVRGDGINIQIQALLKEEEKASWRTYCCMNCHKYTLCFQQTGLSVGGKFMMNEHLKSYRDLRDIETTPCYSPLYRILLRPTEYISRPDCRHMIESFDDLEQRMRSLRLLSDHRLLGEEQHLHDIVRQFELVQRKKLDLIKARAREDSDTLKSLLWDHYSKEDKSRFTDRVKHTERLPSRLDECKCCKPTIKPERSGIPVASSEEIFVMESLDSGVGFLSVLGTPPPVAACKHSGLCCNRAESEEPHCGGPWQDAGFRNCPLDNSWDKLMAALHEMEMRSQM